MLAKILKGLSGMDFHYGKGAVVDIPAALAKSFIKGGVAELVEQPDDIKIIPKIQKVENKIDIPNVQVKNSPRKRANKPSKPKKGAKA